MTTASQNQVRFFSILTFAFVTFMQVSAQAQGISEWFHKNAVAPANAIVRTAYYDTYMTRLFEKDPVQYDKCLALGPTEENIEGALCARATRSMHSCLVNKYLEPCGRYAFTYQGRQCLEKQGLVNVLESKTLSQIHESRRADVCDVPGMIMIFEGRCQAAKGSKQAVPFKECRDRLIEIEGEEAYNKRVQGIMKKKNVTEEEAVVGDQVGHMELVVFKNKAETNLLEYLSYLQRPVPADYYDNGKKHGFRILVGCYLPKNDVPGLIEALKLPK